MRTRRSLVAIAGTALPTVGGACCVGLGTGAALAGGTVGAALAWLTPLLVAVALVVAGGLLLQVRSARPWRRWHELVAISATSYLASALVVVPVVSAVLGGSAGGPVLP